MSERVKAASAEAAGMQYRLDALLAPEMQNQNVENETLPQGPRLAVQPKASREREGNSATPDSKITKDSPEKENSPILPRK